MSAGSAQTRYLLERALLPTGPAEDVLVTVADGRFTEVLPNSGTPPPSSEKAVVGLNGLTLPGFANAHSHAFHRALRGRTQRDRGSFWTWREQMYSLAETLDPDSYFELARLVYREMAAAGITTVGEFHYLHHQADGRPYENANAMGLAVIEAARDAGVRITLLDTLYLAAGIGQSPEGVQRRFTDGDVETWRERVAELEPSDGVQIGQAFHSVRAVPRDQMRADPARPLHVHVSEQRAENEQSMAAYGLTPTQLLAAEGQLDSRTTAVHATHLTQQDISLLGDARSYAAFCPTTERDLGDGIGPGRALHEAGARLTLGSDSHAVIDPFEEMRALELNERLATEQRGHWAATDLLVAGTATGHESLGWLDAGRIAVGDRADLVTITTSSLRTAGTGRDEHTAVFAATAADVVHVVADGKVVSRAGQQPEIGRALAQVIERIWR